MRTRSGPDLNLGRSPSLLGATLYMLAGILALATLWAHFTKIDVTVRALGVVRPEGGVVRIVTEVAGIIAAVSGRERDHVRAGDILVRLEDRETRSQIQTLQEQILLVQEQLRETGLRKADARHVFDLEMQRLELQIQAEREAIKRRRQEHQIQLHAAELRISDALERREMNRQLLEEGVVSQQSQSEVERALRLARAQKEEIEARPPEEAVLEDLRQARVLKRSQFKGRQRQLGSEQIPIEKQLADLRLRVDRAETDRQRLIIRSPVTGTLVSFAALHSGEHLPAGTLVATMARTPTVQVIESWLPNREAENVCPGQQVRLVMTGPESLGGTVLSIAPDARIGDPGSGAYRVLIDFDEAQDLPLGLALEVRFTIRTESLLSLLFSKFRNVQASEPGRHTSVTNPEP